MAITHKMPDTQQAIVGNDAGGLELCNSVPVPELEPDMVMVKTAAVALNPVDTKMQGRNATPGAVAGHDFAGTVVAIGRDAWTAAPIAVGDRVSGAVVVSTEQIEAGLLGCSRFG